MAKKHCKLLFEVNYHEGEIIKETLWAFDLGNNEYCIDSIPFYIYSVAVGDIFPVNIPFDTDYKTVKIFLQEGEDSKKWEYQEGCLSAQHC